MIIRRKHTANFTTIGNALFDDERLEADEVGILAYLLRQHHDWEVRRPALMRRWRLGPVSMKRIINNWMRFGWCQAKKTRLSNGTFSIVYEIRDEPGPELSDDDIRAALSLVSSEAGEDDSEGEHGPDHPPAGEHPPPCQRGVADQGVVGDGVASKKKLLNTDSTNTEPTNAVWVFSDVCRLWPAEHVVSTFTCEKLHADLPETLQQAAYNGVRPYLDDCKANNRKVCDLSTYYRERRWERFQAIKPRAGYTTIEPGSPEFYRWKEYYQATDPAQVRSIDLMVKIGRAITVPSRWPPSLAASTGPPGEHAA